MKRFLGLGILFAVACGSCGGDSDDGGNAAVVGEAPGTPGGTPGGSTTPQGGNETSSSGSESSTGGSAVGGSGGTTTSGGSGNGGGTGATTNPSGGGGVAGGGTVYQWGTLIGDFNASSQAASPQAVPGLSGVLAVAAGDFHTLALLKDGTVRAWGANDKGQLGNGTTLSSGTPIPVLKTPGGPPLANVIRIAAGQRTSLALLSDGTVVQWGVTGYVSINADSNLDVYSPTPQTVPNLANIVAISAKNIQALALDADGKVYHWWIAALQWASSSFFSQTPHLMALPQPAVRITAGAAHALALLQDGTIRAWGANWYGQLGKGSIASSTEFLTNPVIVGAPLTGVVAIGAGYHHSLAILGNGSVLGWGSDGSGQVGDGGMSAFAMPSPVQVLNLSGAVQVDGGEFRSAARVSDGTMRVWGDGGVSGASATAVAVPGVSGVLSVAVGRVHWVTLVAP